MSVAKVVITLLIICSALTCASVSKSDKFTFSGGLFGNITLELDEDEPTIKNLKETVEKLKSDQEKLQNVADGQNRIISEQNEKIENQEKTLDSFRNQLADMQKVLEKAKQKSRWVSVCNSVPEGAVQGGHESNGDPHYVGRAFHNGYWIAAKVLTNGEAFVAYGDKEYMKTCFDVLVGGRHQWVWSSYGAFVQNAIETETNHFVGRVQRKQSLVVGKVLRGKGIYIPYLKKEYFYTNYEVLIEDSLFVE